MSVSELFIRRPVMTTIVMAGLVVFGAMAYTRLPVSDLPNVDFPTISVSASLPGASPETMASSVATPLEKEFSTIAGIDSMSSTNALGSTSITLQFALDRDIDAAALDVQAAIARAQGCRGRRTGGLAIQRFSRGRMRARQTKRAAVPNNRPAARKTYGCFVRIAPNRDSGRPSARGTAAKCACPCRACFAAKSPRRAAARRA